MKRTEAIEAIINYFEENEEEFNSCIEELNSYDGILGDDEYFPMEMIDEFYQGVEPSELMNRIFYGHDADTSSDDNYTEFNPNREYFTYNGYGNLVSSDYKDYSAHLDSYFVDSLIDHAGSIYNIPDEVQEMIEEIED
jgi:hypothetical protein